jgi:MarR family transcriptional regulator, organic hydroperoxide resistance regulator
MSADLAPFLHQILLAAQQLTAPYRARANMTSAEYAGLQHLAQHRDGLTPGQLGVRLAITSGSVTKLVDRLEARRLARRIRKPHADRRSVTVVATNEGVDLISRDLRELIDELDGTGAPPLDPGQREVVGRLLASVRPPAASA